MAGLQIAEDLVQVALRDLDVERKARDAGRLGQPAPDSVTLDAVHQEILGYFSGRLRDFRGKVEADLLRLRADRQTISGKIDIDQARDTFSQLTNAIEPETQALKQKHWDRLFNAKKAEEQAARDLRWYQREHKLQGEAHYPESPLQHFAWVAVIAFLEWIALSAFYAEGSDYGLLGGVLIAMALSVVNISVAIIAGSLLRYFNHRSMVRKVLAGLGVFFLCGCFLVTTLAAAHYRVATNELAAQTGQISSVESEQWKAARYAGQRFAAHPLGFDDVFSWILIVAAVVFGIFAAYKGYRIDDPYPGYGHRDRLHRLRAEQFEKLKESYVRQLEEFFSQTLRRQQELLSKLRRDIDYFNSKCGESEKMVKSYDDEIHRIQEAFSVVIKTYREENRNVAGSPRPAYFNDVPKLEQGLLHSLRALLDEELETRRRYQESLRHFSDLAQRNDQLVQERRAEQLRHLGASFHELLQRVREEIGRETVAA